MAPNGVSVLEAYAEANNWSDEKFVTRLPSYLDTDPAFYFRNKREEHERCHKKNISLRRTRKILLDKYAREVLEEVAMQKVLFNRRKAGDTVSSYFRVYSKLFDDAGVFDGKMQCFHMKNGLRDWKDWQDKLVLVKTETVSELRSKVWAFAALHPNDDEDWFRSPQSQV